jgi:hypothetical protein
MTHTSVAAAHFTEGDLRVGSVINRSATILSRHFLTFFIATLIASSPILLEARTQTGEPTDLTGTVSLLAWSLIGLTLLIVLSALSQAAIVHAAFQDMRRRPVRLGESLNVGLRRLLPLVGLAFSAGFVMLLAVIILIVPGLILYVMWFVWLPACVVERLGPWRSLRRSQQLTKGHRGKLFGLALLLLIPALGSLLIGLGLAAVAGPIAALIGRWIWGAILAAFAAVLVAVAYHDLRVLKEGVDIEHIASVFD